MAHVQTDMVRRFANHVKYFPMVMTDASTIRDDVQEVMEKVARMGNARQVEMEVQQQTKCDVVAMATAYLVKFSPL